VEEERRSTMKDREMMDKISEALKEEARKRGDVYNLYDFLARTAFDKLYEIIDEEHEVGAVFEDELSRAVIDLADLPLPEEK